MPNAAPLNCLLRMFSQVKFSDSITVMLLVSHPTTCWLLLRWCTCISIPVRVYSFVDEKVVLGRDDKEKSEQGSSGAVPSLSFI